MIGNLTIDKASMNISYFLNTVRLIHLNGDRIFRKDFVQQMANFIGLPAQNGGKENRTPYNKSKLPRYFGFVDIETDASGESSLVLTHRGKKLASLISEKDTEDSSQKYYIAPENRDIFIDLIFESVIFGSFGKNNCGAEQSNTDVEPPKVVFRTIYELGKATADEICYIMFGLNRGVFSTFEDALEAVKKKRAAFNYDYDETMEEWKVTNIVHDCKIINIFTSDSIQLLTSERDEEKRKIFYSLSKSLSNHHIEQIAKLDVIYQPLRMLLFSNCDISSLDSWVNNSILGGVSDNSFVFEYSQTEGKFLGEKIAGGAFEPGCFEKLLLKSYQNEKKNIYLIIKDTNESHFKQLFGKYEVLLKRIDNLSDTRHGWSEAEVADNDVVSYIIANCPQARQLIKNGKISIPSNIQMVGVVIMSNDNVANQFDYQFKKVFLDSASPESTPSVNFAWYVGATGNNDDGVYTDFSDQYITEGRWENGWDDRFIEDVKKIQPGDHIALKSSYTKSKGLPFNNNGKTVGVMCIKAIGVVTENAGDGKNIKVDWTKVDPAKEWYGAGVLRTTLHNVNASDSLTKAALLRFTFDGVGQDYTVCEERYQMDSSDEDMDNIQLDDALKNERQFREWMASQKSINGMVCTPSMISNNCSALKKVCQLMDIIEFPDVGSIFEITNLETFLEFKGIIKARPDYDEVNLACNNKYLSTGLKWYEKYLNELQTKAETEDISNTDVDPYTKADFLKEVFLTSEEYDKLFKLLKYKKNIILQGAPGVGKTFLAKRFAYSIIGYKDDRFIEMVQFHQNYSYEDFIMGYKPTDDNFELKTGLFYNFCKKAHKDPDKDHNYFFIIDEINRGNLSKIFGELMMLIEGDKRGPQNRIKLAYRDEEFYVPENLYIIGMLNSADRSLAMMDYALRRRFSFFDVEPAFEKSKFKEHLKSKVIDDDAIISKVIDRFKALNGKIADEDNSGLGKGFCIGHSYFCTPPVKGQTATEWYSAILEYEVSPLLEEYWWDDKSKADDCKKELMKE